MGEMGQPEKPKVSLGVLISLIISGFLLVFLVALIIFFNITNVRYRQYLEKGKEELKALGEALAPSQVVENKAQYKGKELLIRGKVFQEPTVCEKKECPKEDPCCGCKQERNLVIADHDKAIQDKSIWRLRLMGPGAQAFCQRKENSCVYECPGWKMEAIYDVIGTFFAEPPPVGSGWKVYFDFYFEVENKELVKEESFLDWPGRVVESIKGFINKIRGSAEYYILP